MAKFTEPAWTLFVLLFVSAATCTDLQPIVSEDGELVLSIPDRPMLDFNRTARILMCPMYSTKCVIEMSAQKFNDVPVRLWLDASSDNTRSLTIKWIEYCRDKRPKRYRCGNFSRNSTDNNVQLESILVVLDPRIVGKATVNFKYSKDKDDESSPLFQVEVIVLRPNRFIDKFQDVYIIFFSVAIAICMGILLDPDALIKIIKMPVSVAIGFISQYLFMPLLSYAFIKLFNLPPVEALALFLYGCSPGGSGSNNWTIIFDGDIDLSAIMTFVSTLASLFMMPLWLFTLGKTLSNDAKISIPILRLLMNLFITIGPCLLGLVLSVFIPKLKKFILRYIKRALLVLILSFLGLIMISKYYVFKLITWQQWIAGPLIPWCGFLLGAFFAWITKRPVKQIYTISIETGMQNVSIAFMLILLNMQSPESDYAILPLIPVSFLTVMPLWLILIVKTVYIRVKGYKKADQEEAIKNENTLADNKL